MLDEQPIPPPRSFAWDRAIATLLPPAAFADAAMARSAMGTQRVVTEPAEMFSFHVQAHDLAASQMHEFGVGV